MANIDYDRLISLARGQGMNVTELAEKSGISRTTIYALKKHPEQDVFPSTISKLAKTVHVDPDQLIKHNSEPTQAEVVKTLKTRVAQVQMDLDSLERSTSRETADNSSAPEHFKLRQLIDSLSEDDAKKAYGMLKIAFNIGDTDQQDQGDDNE